MGNGKIIKGRTKRKEQSADSGTFSLLSSLQNKNNKVKLKKKRHSSNVFKKIANSLTLTRQKGSNLEYLDDLSTNSDTTSLQSKLDDDESKSQSTSSKENSGLVKRNTNGISNMNINKNKNNQLTSECYMIGNSLEYKKQMKKFIIKLGPCGCETLSQNKCLSMIFKLIVVIEKHFNLGNMFNFDSAFSKLFPTTRIQSIVHKAAAIFKSESLLLELSTTKQDIIVVSDIHGSILDLIKVLNDNGLPGVKTYLFLGNYVDKGTEDIVVVTLLLLLKINYPKKVYLLRGNHEFLDQNSKECFPIRCKNLFGSFNVYRIFNYGFEFLPLAAIIDNDILCVHGGVSQWIQSRNSISILSRPLNKNKDIVSRMIITDLVWADTYREDYGSSNSLGFTISKRGIGFAFNEFGLKNILEKLKVSRLIRGHQPLEEGFKVEYDNLCYTIHLRNPFEYYNSYGSYCILKGIKNVPDTELTLKSFTRIELKKYSLITQIPTLATAANMCRHLISELKEVLDASKFKEQQNAEIACNHCSDMSLYLKNLTNKKRTFVVHDQIKELITNDRELKKKNKIYQIFQTHLKNINHIPIERFPLFLDMIYDRQIRDSQLISSEDLELINKVKNDLKMVNFQWNKITSFNYNNLPFQEYNSKIDIDKLHELKCEIRRLELNF